MAQHVLKRFAIEQRGGCIAKQRHDGLIKCLPGASSSEDSSTLAGVDVAQASLLLCHATRCTGAAALMHQIVGQAFCVLCGAAACLYATCAACLVGRLHANCWGCYCMWHKLGLSELYQPEKREPA